MVHFQFEKDGESMGYAGGEHRHDWQWKGYSIAFLFLGSRLAVLRVERTAR
jgi:hypothetical protein